MTRVDPDADLATCSPASLASQSNLSVRRQRNAR
jgi:hypothetical protein